MAGVCSLALNTTRKVLRQNAYHKTSNISCTKYQNSNVFRLVWQFSLPNPLKPGVNSMLKMWLEQHRQAILQLHLSDQQVYCLIRCDLCYGIDRNRFTTNHVSKLYELYPRVCTSSCRRQYRPPCNKTLHSKNHNLTKWLSNYRRQI